MNNNFINTFGERLEYLMQSKNIDTTKKGADADLARKMIKEGCLPFIVNADPKGALDSARGRITTHRSADSAGNVNGKWLKAYCDFFKCSADYLFGYIDLPTHAKTDIQQITGLTEESIEFLKQWNEIGKLNGNEYSWARISIQVINELLEQGTWLSRDVLIPIHDYCVYDYRYTDPSLSKNDHLYALKNFRLALFTATEGLTACIKSISKKRKDAKL